jgi:hypothetical protein
MLFKERGGVVRERLDLSTQIWEMAEIRESEPAGEWGNPFLPFFSSRRHILGLKS